MSRPHLNENLNAVQMFPFVAVLLCTMGSLLVLLVAVARSSRDQAIEMVRSGNDTNSAVAAAPDDPELQAKLDHVKRYATELTEVRSRAERQLREDQLRLSHVEDHIRRLHDQLAALQLAAEDLNAKEGAHYQDRAHAEQELERLRQLIAESENNIKDLRSETRGKRKSVAILPTEGPKGTRRQPIYLECTSEGVFLQPEGIHFTQQDFMGPLGPSSPLAAALRAAREHLVMQNPAVASGEEAEPYALLVVRPGGQIYFQAACEVIHRAGLDFGYELIDSEWDLKYPTPDPRLATVEFQATRIARDKLQMLLEAAPRMYEGGGWADSGSGGGGYSDDESGGGAGGTAGAGGIPRGGAGRRGTRGGGYLVVAGAPRGSRAGGGNGGDRDETEPGDSDESDGGNGTGNSQSPQSNGKTASADGNKADGEQNESSAGTAAVEKPNDPKAPRKVRLGTVTDEAQPGVAGVAGEDDPDQERSNEYLAGQMPNRRPPPRPTPLDDEDDKEPFKPRGKDWAIKQPPNTVPIRRPIHVVVRNDQIAILPDPQSPDSGSGRQIALRGSTDAALRRFINQLQGHIEGWGIAGQGLAWKPVLDLKVGPDGERRAQDLARLLKDSGIEVRVSVAQHDSGEPSRASR